MEINVGLVGLFDFRGSVSKMELFLLFSRNFRTFFMELLTRKGLMERESEWSKEALEIEDWMDRLGIKAFLISFI